MKNVKFKPSSFRAMLGALLIAALLITAQPIPASAAGDNPEFTTLDMFPALGVSSDLMNVNYGRINTLYGGGTVNNNRGTIASSRGTVHQNHGTIEELIAGSVESNYGTINRIQNTGSLSKNEKGGTIGFVGMGITITNNSGSIETNCGAIETNTGTISYNSKGITITNNSGTVINNYGLVYMSNNGSVEYNQGGGIVFLDKPVEHSRILVNYGNIYIEDGHITIDENHGYIEIKNASVTVVKNCGSIKLGAHATLHCDENMNGGAIQKTKVSVQVTCTFNEGEIIDETAGSYKIVFTGDDGMADIHYCDFEEDGEYYIGDGSPVRFSLPPQYGCEDAHLVGEGVWELNARPEAGSTEFIIICHKCTFDKYSMNQDTHWQVCSECSRRLTRGEHTCEEYVSDDNATCVKDGTGTGKCTVCGYQHSRTVVDSHLTSNLHEHIVIDPRVEPTYTSAGLTEGSHCADCNAVLKAQEILPALAHTWENGICSSCGAKFFEFDAKSLALESALAFRFKGYLNDDNPAEDAYMEFRIGDIRTVNVSLKDAEVDDKGRYVFTCYLNILELDEKIEVFFHDGDVTLERQNPLSVSDYLDLVLANHTNRTEEDMKVINLVHAISNYAHYAQLALDETHNEYTVGEGGTYHGTEARTEINLHTAEDLSQFAAIKTIAEGFTAVRSTSRSLVLDDETAIVLYITPANEEYVPVVNVTDKNGNAVVFTCDKQVNGKYKVVIRGIAAHMLADTYTVNIDDGQLVYTNLSALSYAYSTLAGSTSEAYKNAVSALFDYYLATIEYMN